MGKHPYIRKKSTELNQLRVNAGLTLQDVATKLGTTPQVVGHWFDGKTRPSDKFQKGLSEILGVSVKELQKIVKHNEVKTDSKKHKYIYADNFWVNKRKEAGITLEEFSELLNIDKDKSTIAKYLTGSIMPEDKTIQAMCKIFDVDFETGKSEFIKMYYDWHANHPKKVKDLEVNFTEKDTSEPETTKVEEESKVEDISEIIRENIYKKVSYKEFRDIDNILRSGKGDASILEKIYGNVDYDIFNMIYEIVGID